MNKLFPFTVVYLHISNLIKSPNFKLAQAKAINFSKIKFSTLDLYPATKRHRDYCIYNTASTSSPRRLYAKLATVSRLHTHTHTFVLPPFNAEATRSPTRRHVPFIPNAEYYIAARELAARQIQSFERWPLASVARAARVEKKVLGAVSAL